MATPRLKVEVGFTDGPLTASPTWTTIPKEWVLSFTMTEGRTSETDAVTQPSQASILFDNSTRLFDPEYGAGAYNGGLSPGRQIRVTADPSELRELLGDLGATSWYDAHDIDSALLEPRVLFRGIVNDDGWQQVEYAHPATSRARVVCNDMLGHLAQRPNRFGLFESVLQRFAYREGAAGTGVLHWPLSDTGTEYELTQTFSDPAQPTVGYNERPIYPAGLTGPGTFGKPITAEQAHSDGVLRPSLPGSLDTITGRALIDTGAAGGWTNSNAAGYDTHTFGFGIRLRSYPAATKAPIFDTFATGRGYYINRFGRIYATMNTGVILGGTRLELGVAHHVCDVWDGATATWRLYLDGVEIGNTIGHAIDNATLTTQLYAGAATTTGQVHADLGDVFAIDAALSATDVATLSDVWREGGGIKTVDQANILLESVGAPAAIPGSGRVSVGPIAGNATTIVPILQTLERTEQGRLHYQHSAEQVRFVEQVTLITGTEQTTGQADLTDVSGAAGLTGTLRYSNPQIIAIRPSNRVTANGYQSDATYEDLDSIDTYGAAGSTVSTNAEPWADPDGLASWIVAYQSDTGQAVRSITLQPTSETEAARALTVELFDAVTLTRTPHNLGNQSVDLYRLEGRSITLGSGVADWRLDLYLSKLTDTANPTPWLWGTGQVDVLTGGELYP